MTAFAVLESGFSPFREEKIRSERARYASFLFSRCEYLRRLCKAGGKEERVVIKLAEFLAQQACIEINRHEKPLLKSVMYLRLEIVDHRHRYQINAVLYRDS